MSKRNPKGRDINGVLLLDKASGQSSNSVLQDVKRLFDANKAGHTGSLDPLASGLLPICLGQATKVAQFLLNGDKRYFVRGKLGQISDTGDSEGQVVDFGSIKGAIGLFHLLLQQRKKLQLQAKVNQMDFAIEKTDDDKSWDISYDFNAIAQLLVKENDITYLSELKDKSLSDFKSLKSLLKKQNKDIESQIVNLSEGTLSLITTNGLHTNDLCILCAVNHKIKNN